ncbi:type 2 periplasmic-binding domain-containing protein [Paenibacillus alginolyticus]|uniref:Extracellular solute-binding protein n=1 Tax=Paenibacillus alginolyticus TaxID=59839 RepID=A0ABT4G603_9BACL|nr:extracellular solute-binding protein [Paenibacillus alginolyticus]MCY9691611.1 extracellular solute-binding protein [Paenibacillus alginolyticus]MEC0146953.1 extracellular solute-binding protein [Paenibacillus alginolyticus]
MTISKSRRTLTTLLALFTAVSITACSTDKGSSSSTSPQPTKAADAAQQSAAPAAANADEPGWKSDTKPITFDWYLNFSWFPNKWGVDATSQYITKKTGVNVNFIVPAGNENEKLNTMIASGKLPDFITLGWYEDAVKKMIEGNMVLPLGDLAKQYDPYFFKVADPAKTSWYTQKDGKFYGYPNASSSSQDYKKYGENFVSNQTFLVRKDMYEALGKPDMRTQEGFLNALKAAKEKFPDVNGQPLIPLGLHEFTDTGNYSLEGYIQNFLAVPYEKDGKLYDRSTDPEYVSWLKTFRKANESGLLAKDIFIDKRPQMEEKIAQGRYFAMLYQRSDMAKQNISLYQKDPNTAYIAVDGPANSKKDAPTLAGPGISGWTVTLISKDVKDKARAIKFLSYLISEEGNKDLFLGEKGVSYDTIGGKDQFKPEVVDLLNKDRAAFDKKYGSSYTFWMLMDTNMNLKWAPPSVEPAKQPEDWTKGKTKSFSQYDNITPTGTSEEGIANSKISQTWGKTLPKLLLAKSDAEFDQLFDKFQKDRKAAGLDKVQTYQQKEFESNIKKIAEFSK